MASEDLLIQYPSGSSDQIIPANTVRTVLNRRINGMLRYVTVTVPENCFVNIKNNNISKLYFTNESGTLEFPNGLAFEDTEVVVGNTSTTNPARITFRLIFEL